MVKDENRAEKFSDFSKVRFANTGLSDDKALVEAGSEQIPCESKQEDESEGAGKDQCELEKNSDNQHNQPQGSDAGGESIAEAVVEDHSTADDGAPPISKRELKKLKKRQQKDAESTVPVSEDLSPDPAPDHVLEDEETGKKSKKKKKGKKDKVEELAETSSPPPPELGEELLAEASSKKTKKDKKKEKKKAKKSAKREDSMEFVPDAPVPVESQMPKEDKEPLDAEESKDLITDAVMEPSGDATTAELAAHPDSQAESTTLPDGSESQSAEQVNITEVPSSVPDPEVPVESDSLQEEEEVTVEPENSLEPAVTKGEETKSETQITPESAITTEQDTTEQETVTEPGITAEKDLETTTHPEISENPETTLSEPGVPIELEATTDPEPETILKREITIDAEPESEPEPEATAELKIAADTKNIAEAESEVSVKPQTTTEPEPEPEPEQEQEPEISSEPDSPADPETATDIGTPAAPAAPDTAIDNVVTSELEIASEMEVTGEAENNVDQEIETPESATDQDTDIKPETETTTQSESTLPNNEDLLMESDQSEHSENAELPEATESDVPVDTGAQHDAQVTDNGNIHSDSESESEKSTELEPLKESEVSQNLESTSTPQIGDSELNERHVSITETDDDQSQPAVEPEIVLETEASVVGETTKEPMATAPIESADTGPEVPLESEPSDDAEDADDGRSASSEPLSEHTHDEESKAVMESDAILESEEISGHSESSEDEETCEHGNLAQGEVVCETETTISTEIQSNGDGSEPNTNPKAVEEETSLDVVEPQVAPEVAVEPEALNGEIAIETMAGAESSVEVPQTETGDENTLESEALVLSNDFPKDETADAPASDDDKASSTSGDSDVEVKSPEVHIEEDMLSDRQGANNSVCSAAIETSHPNDASESESQESEVPATDDLAVEIGESEMAEDIHDEAKAEFCEKPAMTPVNLPIKSESEELEEVVACEGNSLAAESPSDENARDAAEVSPEEVTTAVSEENEKLEDHQIMGPDTVLEDLADSVEAVSDDKEDASCVDDVPKQEETAEALQEMVSTDGEGLVVDYEPDHSAVGEPAVEEPVLEDSATEDSEVEQPAVEEPVLESTAPVDVTEIDHETHSDSSDIETTKKTKSELCVAADGPDETAQELNEGHESRTQPDDVDDSSSVDSWEGGSVDSHETNNERSHSHTEEVAPEAEDQAYEHVAELKLAIPVSESEEDEPEAEVTEPTVIPPTDDTTTPVPIAAEAAEPETSENNVVELEDIIMVDVEMHDVGAELELEETTGSEAREDQVEGKTGTSSEPETDPEVLEMPEPPVPAATVEVATDLEGQQITEANFDQDIPTKTSFNPLNDAVSEVSALTAMAPEETPEFAVSEEIEIPTEVTIEVMTAAEVVISVGQATLVGGARNGQETVSIEVEPFGEAGSCKQIDETRVVIDVEAAVSPGLVSVEEDFIPVEESGVDEKPVMAAEDILEAKPSLAAGPVPDIETIFDHPVLVQPELVTQFRTHYEAMEPIVDEPKFDYVMVDQPPEVERNYGFTPRKAETSQRVDGRKESTSRSGDRDGERRRRHRHTYISNQSLPSSEGRGDEDIRDRESRYNRSTRTSYESNESHYHHHHHNYDHYRRRMENSQGRPTSETRRHSGQNRHDSNILPTEEPGYMGRRQRNPEEQAAREKRRAERRARAAQKERRSSPTDFDYGRGKTNDRYEMHMSRDNVKDENERRQHRRSSDRKGRDRERRERPISRDEKIQDKEASEANKEAGQPERRRRRSRRHSYSAPHLRPETPIKPPVAETFEVDGLPEKKFFTLKDSEGVLRSSSSITIPEDLLADVEEPAPPVLKRSNTTGARYSSNRHTTDNVRARSSRGREARHGDPNKLSFGPPEDAARRERRQRREKAARQGSKKPSGLKAALRRLFSAS